AGIEAVRAHPGTYARGVTKTVLRELWHPLFVALPTHETASGSSSGAGGGDTIVVDGKTLPRPSGGDMIPAAHQGFYSTTPHGTIREVWTSPTAHTVVLSTPAAQRRFDAVDRDVGRLSRRLPAYAGSTWLHRQLRRSPMLLPPPRG